MTKFKYKLGDRVRILDGSNIEDYAGTWTTGVCGMDYLVGKAGTVIESMLMTGGKKGYKLKGYPFTFDERGLVLVDDVITIERHGQKMVAKYNGKVGVAKCSEDDEFDMFIGANLALQRLFGKEEKKEEPKWSEGDIVRAKENSFVPTGKIGRVVLVDSNDVNLPIKVRFEGRSDGLWMKTKQVEKLNI